MVILLWSLVGLSLAGLSWVGLIVLALVRELDDQGARIQLLQMAIPGSIGRTGLDVGAQVPAYEATTLAGSLLSSEQLRGRRHLVVFAHPGCGPCEHLVPELVHALERDALPETVIISTGAPDEHPDAWRGAVVNGRLHVAVQKRNEISKRFETFVTPHVFVVTERGEVAAQGIASSVKEVRSLVKKSKHVTTTVKRTESAREGDRHGQLAGQER